MIYDRNLRKVEEKFSAETCDHLKDEAYCLLNFVQNSITDTLQIHESEKSIKISLFSILFHPKIVLEVSFKGCVHYIFASLFVSLRESTCETRKNMFYCTLKALNS